MAITESSSGPRFRRNWKTVTPNRTKNASCSAVVMGSKPGSILLDTLVAEHAFSAFRNDIIAGLCVRGITTLQLGLPRHLLGVRDALPLGAWVSVRRLAAGIAGPGSRASLVG